VSRVFDATSLYRRQTRKMRPVSPCGGRGGQLKGFQDTATTSFEYVPCSSERIKIDSRLRAATFLSMQQVQPITMCSALRYMRTRETDISNVDKTPKESPYLLHRHPTILRNTPSSTSLRTAAATLARSPPDPVGVSAAQDQQTTAAPTARSTFPGTRRRVETCSVPTMSSAVFPPS